VVEAIAAPLNPYCKCRTVTQREGDKVQLVGTQVAEIMRLKFSQEMINKGDLR
jgi:hypothetical protein